MNQSGNSRVGKPRRVLIFSLAYLPRFVGGAEVAVKEITDRILPAEFVFEMITLRDGLLPFERIGGVAVYRVVPAILPLSLAKLLFPFLACLKAISLHRRRPYDAIWSIMAAYAGFGGLFFKLINPRLPFLLTLQEGDPIPEIKKKVRFIYPLFRMIFTKADRISAISNYLAEWAMEMGAGATAVTVIPNGVAVAEFKTRNEKVKREEIRKKFNYKEDDIILVTTSRLVLKNGVGDVITAMRLLPPNMKLLIIGTGYLEFSLKLKVQNEKLESQVKFLGFIGHDKLPPYLWASDIFVRPSLSEGMGNSFIEAMAAGLPVVATPVGGIPDFLFAPDPKEIITLVPQVETFSRSQECRNVWRDKITGLFCEPDNPKSIAGALRLLIADSALRGEIIQNASKMVAEKYDWGRVVRQMRQFFT